ncbi:alkylation response protein AidB-like acyl-CoA dehydrogenase [Allocatelliglobosispora scoriae]|uniref:Broad-specificity linear acyl-CoA dehydrogenase FadE5 n=1 Tax=Allocatelliglobosispora scoriae TaxID=643052 RepID=A0A841BW04_9ACTN|nr:acyl-CoA dehydrogenase [Allocatelliglobosispora scoriae]MBB5871103.1 alkylation response protein AidB-like acyl-CoA dehydrogenase [Allocatelliglobosispora scoriae]
MTHYKSNLRDLEFNLFEVFDNHLGEGPFADVDTDSARGILAEVDRLSRVDLAASFADADRNPPVFDAATHTVKLPTSFKKSFDTFMDSEFWRLDIPSELNGTLAPRAFWWSLAEMILGSNPAIWMYSCGPSFARTIQSEGTDAQREWAKIFVEKRWAATMVLTEPDAGSDVGAARTRAIPQADGSWHIEGVKRFITSGEHDLSENIIHYVLARPVDTPGAGGPGTKGLSLFLVPKFHFDAEGNLGERNGVFATNVEHKMGLKVSATCEMTFGGHGVPAQGWLLGEVHEGIRQMFLIIENARMMVGTKAIATLSTGYLNALEYAKERVQGSDLLQMADKTAPRVTITHHPDVRRSLMLQKSYAEGLRALAIYAAGWADKANLAATAGDEKAAKKAEKVNDLLLPLVKACGSERAFELLGSEALQTFGGSGFLQDYPLEQYVRDAKIDSLYEGTTAIQSLDLFFRKIVKDGGRALLTVAGEISAYLAEGSDGELKEERESLTTALTDIQGALGTMTGWLAEAAGGDERAVYKVGLHSRRLLLGLGDLVVGWLLQRQATVALAALAGDGVSETDRAFYLGKVAAAKFFASEVLPRITTDRKIIESATVDLMDLDESVF